MEKIHATNWVTINVMEYRVRLIICGEIEHEIPVFCRIEKIIVGSVICFLVKKLVVDHFSE